MFGLQFAVVLIASVSIVAFSDDSSTECLLPNGNFPNPNDCTSFIRCQNGVSDVEPCPDGLLFNPFLWTCDYNKTGSCSDADDFKMTSTPEETDDIACPTDGPNVYPIRSSCTDYYFCNNGVAYQTSCPQDLLMNVEKETCDYKGAASCDFTTTDSPPTTTVTAIIDGSGLEPESETTMDSDDYFPVTTTVVSSETQASKSTDSTMIIETTETTKIATEGTSTDFEQNTNLTDITISSTTDQSINQEESSTSSVSVTEYTVNKEPTVVTELTEQTKEGTTNLITDTSNSLSSTTSNSDDLTTPIATVNDQTTATDTTTSTADLTADDNKISSTQHMLDESSTSESFNITQKTEHPDATISDASTYPESTTEKETPTDVPQIGSSSPTQYLNDSTTEVTQTETTTFTEISTTDNSSVIKDTVTNSQETISNSPTSAISDDLSTIMTTSSTEDTSDNLPESSTATDTITIASSLPETTLGNETTEFTDGTNVETISDNIPPTTVSNVKTTESIEQDTTVENTLPLNTSISTQPSLNPTTEHLSNDSRTEESTPSVKTETTSITETESNTSDYSTTTYSSNIMTEVTTENEIIPERTVLTTQTLASSDPSTDDTDYHSLTTSTYVDNVTESSLATESSSVSINNDITSHSTVNHDSTTFNSKIESTINDVSTSTFSNEETTIPSDVTDPNSQLTDSTYVTSHDTPNLTDTTRTENHGSSTSQEITDSLINESSTSSETLTERTFTDTELKSTKEVPLDISSTNPTFTEHNQSTSETMQTAENYVSLTTPEFIGETTSSKFELTENDVNGTSKATETVFTSSENDFTNSVTNTPTSNPTSYPDYTTNEYSSDITKTGSSNENVQFTTNQDKTTDEIIPTSNTAVSEDQSNPITEPFTDGFIITVTSTASQRENDLDEFTETTNASASTFEDITTMSTTEIYTDITTESKNYSTTTILHDISTLSDNVSTDVTYAPTTGTGTNDLTSITPSVFNDMTSSETTTDHTHAPTTEKLENLSSVTSSTPELVTSTKSTLPNDITYEITEVSIPNEITSESSTEDNETSLDNYTIASTSTISDNLNGTSQTPESDTSSTHSTTTKDTNISTTKPKQTDATTVSDELPTTVSDELPTTIHQNISTVPQFVSTDIVYDSTTDNKYSSSATTTVSEDVLPDDFTSNVTKETTVTESTISSEIINTDHETSSNNIDTTTTYITSTGTSQISNTSPMDSSTFDNLGTTQNIISTTDYYITSPNTIRENSSTDFANVSTTEIQTDNITSTTTSTGTNTEPNLPTDQLEDTTHTESTTTSEITSTDHETKSVTGNTITTPNYSTQTSVLTSIPDTAVTYSTSSFTDGSTLTTTTLSETSSTDHEPKSVTDSTVTTTPNYSYQTSVLTSSPETPLTDLTRSSTFSTGQQTDFTAEHSELPITEAQSTSKVSDLSSTDITTLASTAMDEATTQRTTTIYSDATTEYEKFPISTENQITSISEAGGTDVTGISTDNQNLTPITSEVTTGESKHPDLLTSDVTRHTTPSESTDSQLSTTDLEISSKYDYNQSTTNMGDLGDTTVSSTVYETSDLTSISITSFEGSTPTETFSNSTETSSLTPPITSTHAKEITSTYSDISDSPSESNFEHSSTSPSLLTSELTTAFSTDDSKTISFATDKPADTQSTTTEISICINSYGFYPNPDNCASFYQCKNGVPNLSWCLDNEHFNPTNKICEDPCTAKCDVNADCPTRSTEVPSDSTRPETSRSDYSSQMTTKYVSDPASTTTEKYELTSITFDVSSLPTDSSSISETSLQSTTKHDSSPPFYFSTPEKDETSETAVSDGYTTETSTISTTRVDASSSTNDSSSELSTVDAIVYSKSTLPYDDLKNYTHGEDFSTSSLDISTVSTIEAVTTPVFPPVYTTVTSPSTTETLSQSTAGYTEITESKTQPESERYEITDSVTSVPSTHSVSTKLTSAEDYTTIRITTIQTEDGCVGLECLSSTVPYLSTPSQYSLCPRQDILPGSKCNEFINCTTRSPVKKRCPSGLYFNPTKRVCDWPRSSGCGHDAKPLYYPDKSFHCPCKSCLVTSNHSCTEYYLCLGYTAYRMRCSGNLSFDRRINTCTYAVYAECLLHSTTTSTTSTSTTKKPTTKSTTRKPTISSTTKLTTASTRKPTTTTSKPKPFECADRNGYYTMPDNCQKFIQCSNWRPYVMSCPAALHFSEVTQRCEYPCDAKCDPNLHCEGPTATPNHPRCTCRNCRLPSPITCTKYIECKDGKPTMVNCFSGQTFDVERGVCDWAHKVNCRHSQMCPHRDGMFSHKEDCHKFIHCSNGIPYVKNCPAALEFDEKTQRCEWPAGRCEVSPVDKEFSIPKKEDHREGWKCPQKFGAFPDDDHCNKFYYCSFDTPSLKECSDGLMYNPKHKTCDWERHVHCNSNRHYTQRRCRRYDRHVRCPEARTPLPHNRCYMYYDCSTGIPCAKQCPVGLYFNKTAGLCDSPKNVKCYSASTGEFSLKNFSEQCEDGSHKQIVDPSDESCFFRCRKGEVISGCCQRDRIFDERSDKCVHKHKSFRI